MRIAYLGIDLLKPVLDALLREGCRVLKLFTCPVDNVTEFNTAALQTARERGIPYTRERITAADLDELAAQGCELLVCAGYYYRVPVTDAFPMVNFHPTPLPVGRGSWPMPRLILEGAGLGGVTAHKMAADFDTGDILLVLIILFLYLEDGDNLELVITLGLLLLLGLEDEKAQE